MYVPRFKKKSNSVPILSQKDIDSIAEQYIRDFQPEALSTPMETNIDLFIEDYLGLTLDYQYLSSDKRYLGMTVFNDTNKVVIFKPEENQADYISARAGTIIIDNSLLEENQLHRYRYTAGHESGHWIFHRDYYGYDPNQLTLFELNIPYIQCREINKDYYGIRDTKKWDDNKWMEWHADKFASAMLMPKASVDILLSGYKKLRNTPVFIRALVSEYNVSAEAAKYRLIDLGYIKRNYNNGYEQLSLI